MTHSFPIIFSVVYKEAPWHSIHNAKRFWTCWRWPAGPSLEQLPLDEARKVPYNMIELGGAEEPVAQVDTRVIPGPVQQIPVRVYRPTLEQDLPALMYFHGGGFVICNLDTHDRLCRSLARASGCVVVVSGLPPGA